MAITAAQVEANGWVLRLTLTGSLSSASVSGFALTPDTPAQAATNFGAYALAPNGTPALTLAAATSGFVQSAGTAVASSAVARALVGTKALRKAVVATAAGVRDAKNPDEADLGGGSITVRIALSQHIYAGDTNLTLTVLAGWRTGEAAASGIAVTNNSTVAAPAPIVRWSDVPYQLQSGSFQLECAVASHHPNGLAPVAGVKFTVTDGTTVKTFWTTALSTSTAYSGGGTGKGLRVYAVTVDPTTATALTKGLLRCDFEVYPWLGPVQKSDVAGTKSMTGLGTAGFATAAQIPFVVAYNPGGSWITPRYAYVDATSGSSTAAAANVSTNAATAAATPLATVNLALESLRLHAVANTGVGTLVAANGQAAITQSLDGCRVRIKAGVAFGGSTAVTSGAQTLATWLVVEGDPADSAPLTNCIVRAPASANGASQITRIRFAALSIEAQSLPVLSTKNAWVDGAEVRGVTGQEATTGVPFGVTNGLVYATAGKWWKHGSMLTYAGSQITVLVRNMLVERSMNAPAIFNVARLSTAATIANNHGISSTGGTLTDAGYVLDRLAIGNDLRYLSGASIFLTQQLANASAPSNLTLGKPSYYNIASRCAYINNVGETFNGSAALWSSVGEYNSIGTVAVVATENIFEGNTFTGDRVNSWYNLLGFPTIAANDSEDNIVRVNRVANNVYTKNATKQDRYYHGLVQTQRIGVALSTTRSKAYIIGDEIVIAGSPANVYHCSQAGTTASTGGPTGTGSGIVDGAAKWDWFATENRQHGYRPQATGAWSSLYGVMAEGNIDLENLNDGPTQGSVGSTYTGNGTAGSPEFNFEFYGMGSQSLYADGINLTATPFTTDLSGGVNRQPWQTGSTTGGGNYRPVTTGPGLYILGRAKSANSDVDQAGVARAIPFAAGGLGVPTYALLPASAREATRATTPAVGWTTTLAVARGVLATRAAAAVAGWTALLAPRGGVLATRAAATVIGWTTQLGARGAAMAMRATTTIAAWTAQLAPTGGILASQAQAGATGWTATLIVDDGHLAMLAAAGTITWRGALTPASARATTVASSTVATSGGTWSFVVDSGRIHLFDTTLPILLPGTPTPPERTLMVTGDFRTTIIPGPPFPPPSPKEIP